MKSVKFVMTSVGAMLIVACSNAASSDLNEVHTSIEQRYDLIPHLDAETFTNWANVEFLLFDTREREEYDVSHIEGAIWLDPATKPIEFIEKYGAQAHHKDVIFYCSVGERSSRLAQSLYPLSQGKFQTHNLKKGIFGWHNEQRPLVQGDGSTDKIHPYDEKWGRLVERRDKVRYEPE